LILPNYATDQVVKGSLTFEERTALFYEAIGVSAGSLPKMPGVDVFNVYRDKYGDALRRWPNPSAAAHGGP
jgi:hypothetical protein